MVDQRRVTNFLHVPKQITRVFQNKRESIIQLLKLGMKLGSKSASAIVATVELMLEEQRYEEALDICNQVFVIESYSNLFCPYLIIKEQPICFESICRVFCFCMIEELEVDIPWSRLH